MTFVGKTRPGLGSVLGGAAILLWTALSVAQPAPALVPPPGAPPPGGPGAPAPPPVVLAPGVRIGTGQAAVVGGNSAGARERALDEALRQAVDQSLGELLDPAARAAQVKPIRALMSRARTYVKRYRTLEEGEVGGNYAVRVEAEVDEPALRRATERWSAPATPVTPVATGRSSVPSVLVVGSGVADATAALVAALAGVGAPAQAGDPSLVDPARALAAATRVGAGAVVFVSATVTDEGTVRGAGKEAVSCRLTARLVSVPAGQPLSEQGATPRAFADRPDAARADCLSRAAAEIAARLVPAAPVATPGGADLKAVTVDAGISEPAAVPALLKALRGLGSVSAADLRRLAGGRAEIRVQTRLAPVALAASLTRESASVLELASVEPGGDSVRLQVRLRPPVPPGASSVPGPPGSAAPAGGAQ